MQQWPDDAPLFIEEQRHKHPGKQADVWFQDEARPRGFGQQGTLTNVWDQTGSRPAAVKQTQYQWCHLFGAACPTTGESSAILRMNLACDRSRKPLGSRTRLKHDPYKPGLEMRFQHVGPSS